MITYPQSKSPAEMQDYTFDWAPSLTAPEAVVSVSLTMIDAAGCTQPHAVSVLNNLSRVWLGSGSDGGRCIFTLRALTDSVPPRELEESFAVNIVASTYEPTEADKIATYIAALKDARLKIVSGERVKEIMRNGRRMVFTDLAIGDVDSMILKAERDLEQAAAAASGAPRRRAIRLGFSN